MRMPASLSTKLSTKTHAWLSPTYKKNTCPPPSLPPYRSVSNPKRSVSDAETPGLSAHLGKVSTVQGASRKCVSPDSLNTASQLSCQQQPTTTHSAPKHMLETL
ncbi:hypothetical protein ACJQWK_06288 [Exserohilum turcicum]